MKPLADAVLDAVARHWASCEQMTPDCLEPVIRSAVAAAVAGVLGDDELLILRAELDLEAVEELRATLPDELRGRVIVVSPDDGVTVARPVNPPRNP